MKALVITKSSNIGKIEFENNTLYVTFLNGSRYAYSNVPEAIYDEMSVAESAGKYFWAKVRNSYAYQRV